MNVNKVHSAQPIHENINMRWQKLIENMEPKITLTSSAAPRAFDSLTSEHKASFTLICFSFVSQDSSIFCSWCFGIFESLMHPVLPSESVWALRRLDLGGKSTISCVRLEHQPYLESKAYKFLYRTLRLYVLENTSIRLQTWGGK